VKASFEITLLKLLEKNQKQCGQILTLKNFFRVKASPAWFVLANVSNSNRVYISVLVVKQQPNLEKATTPILTSMFDSKPEYHKWDETSSNQFDTLPDIEKVVWFLLCQDICQQRLCSDVL